MARVLPSPVSSSSWKVAPSSAYSSVSVATIAQGVRRLAVRVLEQLVQRDSSKSTPANQAGLSSPTIAGGSKGTRCADAACTVL